MKTWILSCAIAIFSFMLTQCSFNNQKENFFEPHEIHDFISSLDKKEKEYLTNFFKLQFFRSSWGYTIFGEKPMSFEVIDYNRELECDENFDYMAVEHILAGFKLKEGWATWKKYANRFHQNNIIIIQYPFHLCSNCLEVPIINRSSFIKVIDENLDYFQLILGESYSSSQILRMYFNGEGSIFHKIRLRDDLFGTLLGYGLENAIEFNRLGRASELMESFTPSEETDKELMENGTKNILPPMFAVIPDSEETLKLRSSYNKQRTEINQVYQSPDFLEKVLIELAQ
jgi:hypothetical protein